MAQGYKLKAAKETYKVKNLGSRRPVKVLEGEESYTLELSRVYITNSELDFYSLSDFSLTVVKPDCQVVFGGCEWAEIEETQEIGLPCFEKMKLVANRRDVV